MTPSVTLVRVFDRSWAAWLDSVNACRHKPSRRRVHALRVECRRLEALVEVLRHATDAPAEALRHVRKMAVEPLDVLSTLRDDQVQFRRLKQTAGADHLEALRDDVERRRDRHMKRARHALADIDLAKADLAARRIRHSVVRRQGAPTPAQRAQLLIAAADTAAADFAIRMARLAPSRPRTLHRLRVAAKRVRYLADIVAEIAPQVQIAAVADVRALQRELGHVHDADLLTERIDKIAPGRHRAEKKALRAFRATIVAERTRALRELSRTVPMLRGAAHRAAG
jgi:CHAD domain-containing protein